MARRRYLAVAAVAVVAVGLLVSWVLVRAQSPWWSGSGACAPPALVRLDGHVMAVGNCAAVLGIPAGKATVHVGQQLDVHMTEEGAGPSGNRMIPIYPLPRSSRSSVVMPGTISADKATGSYLAVRPGQAVLLSHGRCLVSRGFREVTGSCPVLAVTVVP